MEDIAINANDQEMLIRDMTIFRRAVWHDMFLSTVQNYGDFSLIQATILYILDDRGELPVKQVAETIERSVSATSRMLDQLVEHGWITRREDERDRRVKQVSITPDGQAFLWKFERNRVAAQLNVMSYLSEEEQALVTQAMALLAKAARRRNEHTES